LRFLGEYIDEGVPLFPLWLWGRDWASRSELRQCPRFQVVNITRTVGKDSADFDFDDSFSLSEIR
jgi:hypothetical protein